MFGRMFVAGLALVVSGTVSGAVAQDRWVRIGSFDTELNRGSQVVDLEGVRGSFKAFRLDIKQGEARLNNIQVRYLNGEAHNENRPINLLRNERTRPIDQRATERFAEGLTVCFDSNQRGPVSFEVYGLQSRRGATAARPAVTSRMTWQAACPSGPGSAPVSQRPTTGPIAATPTTPIPQTAPTGAQVPGGAVLFGVQNVGFIRDRDVIRVGANLGQFDRIQLRVLDNDVFISELDVIYVDGTTQKLIVNSDVRQNTRTRWLDITGTKFIKEINMLYRSRPTFKGQARIEVYGQFAEGWLGANGRGREFNEGWVLLGAQTAGRFLRQEEDRIEVGRNEGLFKRVRVTVKDRALVFDRMTVVYGNGETETIPVKTTVAANSTFGPVDLRGTNRVIREIRVRYRSAVVDAKAAGRGAAVVEIWGQH